MALLTTITDDFSGSSIDSGIWTEYIGGSATASLNGSGQLLLALPSSSTASDYATIETDPYDFTDGIVQIEVNGVPDQATTANGVLYANTDSNNWFRIVLEQGTLYFQRKNAGVSATLASVAFVLATHKWWRIREYGGDVKYETSPDGYNWTEQASYTHGMTITSMKGILKASTYENVTDPGTFTVESFNVFEEGTRQNTTAWASPTISANDDTIGSTDWSQIDQIFANDSLGFGDNSAIGYFLAGGDQFTFNYAHIVINGVIKTGYNEKSTPDVYPFSDPIGSSSNLWGESSIAGSDINNENFGVAISFGKYDGVNYTDSSKKYLVATGFEDLYTLPDALDIQGIELTVDTYVYAGGGGTQGIGIDTLQVRATYSFEVTIDAPAKSFGGVFVNPPNRKLPQKKFIYKAYSPDGDYLGNWRDVASDPEYKQDINNILGSMPISFARNDLSIDPTVDTLLNEDDNPLTDESDSPFLIDTSPVSALGSGTNLDTNYDVAVDAIYGQFEPLLNEDGTPILNEDASMILVEDGYPLGRTIFRGYIPRWELPLSGNGITGEIRSYSQDLDNIILETEDTVDISNFTEDGSYFGMSGGGPGDFTGLAQTFTASTKTYSKIRLKAFAGWFTDVDFTVSIYTGTNPNSLGTFVGSGTAIVNRDFPVPYVDVPFDVPLDLTAGGYTMIFDTPYAKTGGNPTYPFNLKTSSAYGGGAGYYRTTGSYTTGAGFDFCFELFEAGGETTVPFTSKDPSQILRSIVDFASGRGARINYTPESIEVTETLVTYTFQTNTIKEAIEKVLELCPSNWYYYYDFGTDTIYLKERSATPDRWLRKGQSVVDGKIVKTIENIVNDVLFSGGGDPALYIRETNNTSILANRRGLKKISDSRVTDTSTASILANAEINKFADALHAGDVTITEDGTFYLEDVAVGEVIGFIGFGRLVDSLIVQSTSKDYKPDIMPLALTYNIPKINKRVEDIKRNLQVLENANNPAEPS